MTRGSGKPKSMAAQPQRALPNRLIPFVNIMEPFTVFGTSDELPPDCVRVSYVAS